jgi:hypothetical protein
MMESKYKEGVKLLIEHLNNLAKDPLRGFKGNFRVEAISTVSVGENGTEESMSLYLVYTDIATYIPISIDVILKPANGIIQPEPDPYEYFYRSLINFILLAIDTSEGLRDDSRGNIVVTIPFGKLLREGYGR